MSAYNYGYGTPAAGIYAAGQTYPAVSYAAPTAAAAAYGYATSQPAARAVPVYQATTYATTGFTQPTAVAAANPAGYGYFQRAGEPAISYTAQKTSTAYAVTQASYGYGTTASTKTTYASTVPTYIKPQTYVSSPAITPIMKPSATSAIQTVVAGATADHKNAYEKVVFNAATSFLTQQSSTSKTNSWNKKPQFRLQGQKGGFGSRPAGVPPKPQQLHYCEVCKISCAGPQTYKEHLEGQKHKKKAASAQKEGKLQPGTYKCELCDVICTGKDAYAAHVKGGNHQKVVKLHQKLGKPIPEVKIPEPSEPAAKKSNPVKTTAPKINFVGGSKLVSATDGRAVQEQSGSASGSQPIHMEEDAEPVGEDQVEEVKSDVGKVIGYKCNLCDCRFNDVIAKNAHCKGRKHRLQYKKKIDPSLVVHIPDHAKRNSRGNRQGGRGSGGASGGQQAEMAWQQRQQEQMRYWTRPDRHRMHELEYYEWERRERYMDPPKPLFGPSNGPVHGPDDKLVMAKHQQIYPDTDELAAVQSIVQATEKALKLVSDSITDEQNNDGEASAKEEDTASEKSDEKKTDEKKPEPLMAADNRVLKGVMRVGVLAKGLLLKGQLNLELVVLCAEKPTYTLLKKVGKLVPEKLKEVTDEKLNMSISVVQCAILITSTTDPKVTVKVTLTSPSMREGDEPVVKEGEEKKAVKADPKDVLDKEKCLQALAALRHAKWFQARANQVQSCVITIRILREMCQREAAFKPLQCWPLELLCEKALASYPVPIGPGEAFRRVMEALASGILLEGGSGLLDPCEKEITDTAGSLSSQEREGITAAAQNAVRLQAFRQLHKVLGVDPLQPVPRTPATRPAKRTADAAEEGAAGGKAPKKEEE